MVSLKRNDLVLISILSLISLSSFIHSSWVVCHLSVNSGSFFLSLYFHMPCPRFPPHPEVPLLTLSPHSNSPPPSRLLNAQSSILSLFSHIFFSLRAVIFPCNASKTFCEVTSSTSPVSFQATHPLTLLA